MLVSGTVDVDDILMTPGILPPVGRRAPAGDDMAVLLQLKGQLKAGCATLKQHLAYVGCSGNTTFDSSGLQHQ